MIMFIRLKMTNKRIPAYRQADGLLGIRKFLILLLIKFPQLTAVFWYPLLLMIKILNSDIQLLAAGYFIFKGTIFFGWNYKNLNPRLTTQTLLDVLKLIALFLTWTSLIILL